MADTRQRTISASTEGHDRTTGGASRTIRRSLAATIVLVAALLTAGAAPAAASSTVYVNEGDSIQAAVDDADPGTVIIVKGDHTENVTITTDDITLRGRGATLTMPDVPTPAPEPCQPEPGVEALICVIPATWSTFAEAPPTRVTGVNISGFTLNSPTFDAISIQFTDDVRVTDNTIPAPGCDGVFVIFGDMVQVNRNTVTDAGCTGVNVSASNNARVQSNNTNSNTFSGINISDTSRIVVNGNTANGNCLGISLGDGADGGYGVQPDPFSGSVARVSNNVANSNNRTCPFGDGGLIGGTGIIAGGVSNLTVSNNTTNGNVVEVDSFTASGIAIIDLPEFDGSVSVGNIVKVLNNTARGNSSPAGPVDVVIATSGHRVQVSGNNCGVSVANPAFCS